MSFYTSLNGLKNAQTSLNVISHNIANGETNGFKKSRVEFADIVAGSAYSNPKLIQGVGATVEAIQQNFALGPIEQTGSALDVAINGDGFFSVDTTRGVRYTRDGSFQLGTDGTLVTADGNHVRGQNGAAIAIPQGSAQVAIDADGTVRADGNEVGKLELVHLDRNALTHDADNLVASKKAPLGGTPPTLISGAIEGSNVNVVRGVVDLVKVSRTYESLVRVIEGYHECESRAAQTLGAPK